MKIYLVLLALLLSLQSTSASLCGENQLQVGDHCINSQECLPYSSSMYFLDMRGKSTFDKNGQDFNITFEALNVYVPDCIDGYIKDSANRTMQYTGNILNPTFRYTYNEIWNHCSLSGETVHNCEFVYTLFIQKSFYVNFNVNASLNFRDMQNFEQEANVTFGQKQESQLQQQLQYQEVQANRSQGLNNDNFTIVNKDYSLKSSIPFIFNTQIVFYTSPLFKFALGDRTYSYGSDIYAQLQVEQDYQAKGYELEYYYSTINGQDVNYKSIAQGSDGSLNLIYHPEDILFDITVTLKVHYWFRKKNKNSQKFLD